MIRLASPPITNDIARVAISALIRKNVATTPLTTPTTRPTAIPIKIAGAGAMCCASSAAVTAASVYTAPTDRSMPPDTSTSVPAAAMINVADC